MPNTLEMRQEANKIITQAKILKKQMEDLAVQYEKQFKKELKTCGVLDNIKNVTEDILKNNTNVEKIIINGTYVKVTFKERIYVFSVNKMLKPEIDNVIGKSSVKVEKCNTNGAGTKSLIIRPTDAMLKREYGVQTFTGLDSKFYNTVTTHTRGY